MFQTHSNSLNHRSMWGSMWGRHRWISMILLAAAICGAGARTAQAVPSLGNGQTVHGISGMPGSLRHFAIWVPAGQMRLTVQTWGGIGDADLYVRRNAPANPGAYYRRSIGYTNSEYIQINAPAGGWWYIAVHGWTGYLGANLRAAFQPYPGVSVSGFAGSMKFFYTNVPSGTSRLTIRLRGGSGDPDLYVARGYSPSTSSYFRRSINWGTTETIVINNPAPGTWYMMVHGYSAYSNVRLQVLLN